MSALPETSDEVRRGRAQRTDTPPRELGVLARSGDPAVAVAVAGNPAAGARTLWWLAARGDAAVQQAICRNPAAPRRLLFRLGKAHVEALAGNPIAARLLEEHAAGQAPLIPGRLLGRLLVSPSAPPALIASAAAHRFPSVRQAAAASPGLAAESRDRLAGDVDERVRAVIAARSDLPEPIARRLAEDPARSVRAAIAGNPRAPVELLAVRARDEEWAVRRAVASNPSAPWSVRALLVADLSDWVREDIARRLDGAPAWVLEQLARDPSDRVRTLLAVYPGVPGALLESLAGDPSINVRAKLAEHPATPPSVVEALAADPIAGVRRAVVQRRGLPERLFVRLAADEDEAVRTEVASGRNPATPTWLIEQLTRDASDGVRIYAIWSGRLSEATLRRLARDPEPLVRRRVAENERTPLPVVQALLQDRDGDVVWAAGCALARRQRDS